MYKVLSKVWKYLLGKKEVMLSSNSINCYMQSNIKITASYFTKLSFTNMVYRDIYWMHISGERVKYIKAYIVIFNNSSW